MRYNVAQLLKESVGATRSYKIDETVWTEDDAFPSAHQGKISLMRTDKGIWASARVDLGLMLICGRCLKPFQSPLRIAIDEEYLPIVDINTGTNLAVPERAEGSFIIDHQHVLDLKEAMRQYTIANQPMKPLCREDCRGLCTICGGDRNELACSCEEGTIEPQWSPLLELLESDKA